MFEIAIQKIRRYGRIILHRHTHPDGDAIGSQVGLAALIRENFPEKEVYLVGDDAGRYSFMEGSTPDVIPDEYYRGALAIVLDTSGRGLISDGRYQTAEDTLRIDHHLFIEQICADEIVDTSYESCCGLITDLAIECGLRVDRLAAKSLYTGMATDSGRFRYDCTTAETFRRAGFLMQHGVDLGEVYGDLYADDFSSIQLRASYVLKIRFTEHRVAYIHTTAEEIAAGGLDPHAISRGMVGTMGDIRGVDIWVNFTDSDAGVLCEIRSSKYNINPIAVKYGGGGHKKASGATVADYATALKMLADLDEMAGQGHE